MGSSSSCFRLRSSRSPHSPSQSPLTTRKSDNVKLEWNSDVTSSDSDSEITSDSESLVESAAVTTACKTLQLLTNTLPYQPLDFTVDDLDNVHPATGWHRLPNCWYQDDIGRVLVILDGMFYYQLYLNDDVVIGISWEQERNN